MNDCEKPPIGCAPAYIVQGERMNDYGTEKKQCFDDYENGTLIMSGEKCADCDHRHECRFIQFYKDYIFDGWAFGDLWSSGIDAPDRAIAWAYMPGAYMGEIVRKEEDLE